MGERVRTAGLKPVEGALSGTLRYRKGELILAVDERTHRLIALYEEYKDLGPQQLREVVGRLMALFGEPTFEAHDRMLFWYFTEKGKVSRETFEGWREAGVKPSLLAVAKFVCGRPIVEFAKKEKGKGHTQAYFTLYSPLLIHRVLKERTLKESL
ncbi:hypothetical protein [Thermosulfurimonas sp.]|uniref:hypothetical protein n=1 Tax=Thermosulfurimonas sp. TaxID=2080236 RepID=UPI0025D981F3|nr:hypothetical protein [Thermosulfurimonas sp.]